MNTIQDIQLELIRRSSFNEFDGERVAESLEKNRQLWRGVIMDREEVGTLIKLRDIEDDQWNVDTLFILPVEGKEQKLEALAGTWGADEIDWIGYEKAMRMLGSWNSNKKGLGRRILRVWFD